MAPQSKTPDPRLVTRRSEENSSNKRTASRSPRGGTAPQRKFSKTSNLESAASSGSRSSLVAQGPSSLALGTGQDPFVDHDIDNEIVQKAGKANRLLKNFAAQSAKVASFQTAVDQAHAQLLRAKHDYEESQRSRFSSFAAIKDQQSRNLAKAKDKYQLLEQQLEKQRELQEGTAAELMAVLFQASHVGPNPSVSQVTSRDLLDLKSEFSDLRTEIKDELESKMEAVRQQNISATDARTMEQRNFEASINKKFDEQTKEFQTNTARLDHLGRSNLTRLDALDKRLNDSMTSASEFSDLESKVGQLASSVSAIETGNQEKDNMVGEALDDLSNRIEAVKDGLADLSGRLEREGFQSFNPEETARTLNELNTKMDESGGQIKRLQEAQNKLGKWAQLQKTAPPTRHFTPALPTNLTENTQNTHGHLNGHGVSSNGVATTPSPVLEQHRILYEIEQLKAASRSAKHRLDNLTTDEVARVMVDQLAQLYPDVKHTQTVMAKFQQELQGCQQSASHSGLQVASMSSNVLSILRDLANVKTDLQACQKSLKAIEDTAATTTDSVTDLLKDVGDIKANGEKKSSESAAVASRLTKVIEKIGTIELDGNRHLENFRSELQRQDEEIITLGGSIKALAGRND